MPPHQLPGPLTAVSTALQKCKYAVTSCVSKEDVIAMQVDTLAFVLHFSTAYYVKRHHESLKLLQSLPLM